MCWIGKIVFLQQFCLYLTPLIITTKFRVIWRIIPAGIALGFWAVSNLTQKGMYCQIPSLYCNKMQRSSTRDTIRSFTDTLRLPQISKTGFERKGGSLGALLLIPAHQFNTRLKTCFVMNNVLKQQTTVRNDPIFILFQYSQIRRSYFTSFYRCQSLLVSEPHWGFQMKKVSWFSPLL